jgi:hypothetical protein
MRDRVALSIIGLLSAAIVGVVGPDGSGSSAHAPKTRECGKARSVRGIEHETRGGGVGARGRAHS